MKKSITVVLILFAALIGQAQTYICRVDTTYYFDYPTASSLKQLSGRKITYFNSSNKDIKNFYQNWNSVLSIWENTAKDTSVYDFAMNKTQHSTIFWNTSSNTWFNVQRQLYSYNSSNLKIEEISQTWSTTLNNWENLNKLNYSYNSNSKVTEMLYQGWIVASGSWLNNGRVSITYNSFNYPTEEIEQTWSTGLGNWVNFRKTTFAYPSSQIEDQRIIQNWNASTSSWENFERVDFDYDINKRKIEEVKYSWNGFSGIWLNSSILSWTYNANNDILTELKQDWAFPGVWENEYKYSYHYTPDNHLVAMDYENDWNTTSSTFDTREREEYICRLIPTSVSDLESATLTIYPNPLSAEKLHIILEKENTVLIMDMKGKVVYNKAIEAGENQINLSSLQSGLYIVKAGNSIQKLIKE